MPRRTTFKGYSVKAPTKHQLNVESFKGVDYRPAQLSVDNAHAVDIQNIVWKDFVNQKRKGFEEIAGVPTISYKVYGNQSEEYSNENEKQINGVYIFVGEDNTEHILVHAGKLLFEVKNIGEGFTFLNAKWELVARNEINAGISSLIAVELNNRVSCGFVASKRLYLLDGIKYRVVRCLNSGITIEDVEDNELTYVPTTTIGIGISWKDKESENASYNTLTTSQATPLDDVNMLTQWRRNKLVTGLYDETKFSYKTSPFYEYTLDTNIIGKKATDLNDITLNITTTEAYNGI